MPDFATVKGVNRVQADKSGRRICSVRVHLLRHFGAGQSCRRLGVVAKFFFGRSRVFESVVGSCSSLPLRFVVFYEVGLNPGSSAASTGRSPSSSRTRSSRSSARARRLTATRCSSAAAGMRPTVPRETHLVSELCNALRRPESGRISTKTLSLAWSQPTARKPPQRSWASTENVTARRESLRTST